MTASDRIVFTFLLAVCTLFCVVEKTKAMLPTAEIHLFGGSGSSGASTSSHDKDDKIFATEARYGPRPRMVGRRQSIATDNEMKGRLMLPPTDDHLLCDEALPTPKGTVVENDNEKDSSLYKDAIIMVPRGECTYMRKTLAAQALGAKGVIIRNNLAARYTMNKTAHSGERYPSYSFKDILWPLDKIDYDCALGQASIQAADLSFDPLPYNANQNDPLLSGDTDKNLCKLYADDNLRNCPSKRCFVTNDDVDPSTSNSTSSSTVQACCAWDLFLEPAGDSALWQNYTVSIPTVFLTMEEGDNLLSMLQSKSENSQDPLMVALYARWEPTYNISALLIWMLGVAVCALAAYCSASDYHRGITYYLKRMSRESTTSHSQQARSQRKTNQNQLQHRPSMMQEETLQLEPIHAVVFMVMASTSLLVLFFFKIYGIVKVMYAFGCSNAVIQVIVYPVTAKVLSSKYCNLRERVLWRSQDLGDVTNWDCIAAFIGYCWGMSWLYMALFVPHASDTSTFYWVSQNVLGACMCITFVGLIQLNSISVASILLVVAFVYDIFFVFVTPLIFNKSVMITVATSGGPPAKGPEWCEKYPTDKDCQGGDPLPMLLQIPKLFDYQPGSSLLGLGDIVLPGLLLSFACRLDAAKYLVALASGTNKTRRSELNSSVETGEPGEQDGVMSSNIPASQNSNGAAIRRVGSSSYTMPSESAIVTEASTYPDVNQAQHTLNSSWWCCICAWASYHCCGNSEPTALSALLFGGGGYYFLPLCVAYAIGLLMANMAVYLMQMGQPALLYLVPCTLGTMCYLGWRRQELRSLWEGPKVIDTADRIMSGRHGQRHPSQSRGAAEEDHVATTEATTIVDDDTGKADSEDDNDEGDVPLLATKAVKKAVKNGGLSE